MQKFTSIFKFPCNYHCNSPARARWDEATPEKNPEFFGVAKWALVNGELYVNREKHYSGVINQRAEGGKWEHVPARRYRRIGNAFDYLRYINAKEANFRGGPRASK